MIQVTRAVSINFERSIRRLLLNKRMVTSCARLLLFVRNSGPSELSEMSETKPWGVTLIHFNRVISCDPDWADIRLLFIILCMVEIFSRQVF